LRFMRGDKTMSHAISVVRMGINRKIATNAGHGLKRGVSF